MTGNVVASVVITCFNLQQYIGDAIDSVLCQDFRGCLEIVVVDDASTDASVEVIARYEGVRLIRMPSNSGVLLATIAGIRHCTGDLIFFMDGDDLWMPQKIRLAVDIFSLNHDVGLVTHDIDFIGAGGESLKTTSSPCEVLARAANPCEMVKRGILNHLGCVWLGSAYGLRKSKVELAAFCRWAESLPNSRETYQDWPLAYWCASIGSVKCAYVHQVLMSYRVHGSNYSGDARTVEKAIRNLRKGYFTAAAICKICQARGIQGYSYWLSQGKELYYLYMIDLYRGRRLWAGFRFAQLQPYFIASSKPFLKEWARFWAIFILGAERFTLVFKD